MIEKALESKTIRTLYAFGPPGSGKTWAAYHIGRVEKGFYAITITDETSAAELRGHFIFKGGDAIWHDGPFVRAMREGKRLVINEITNASADVLALLNPILEGEDTSMLTLPSGETISPAPGFHVIATDNRKPELLPECLQDRFDGYIEVTETNPAAYAVLSKELRPIAEQKIGDGDRRISARGWIALDKLRGEFGLHDACRLVFGPERGRMVNDAIALAMDQSSIPKEVSVSAADVTAASPA
jgi:SpoVK/Ycf46/Vps4 family AAA+-type ATPase